MKKTITLPVFDSKGSARGKEDIEADELGENRYRLLQSPGFAEGLAAGDEIALDESAQRGVRVLRRGGNLCVWLFVRNPSAWEAAGRLDEIKREVEALGGYLDGGARTRGNVGSLVFTVPLKSAGWKRVEQLFNRAAQQTEGSSWMYANVYDPVDGSTPLNWW